MANFDVPPTVILQAGDMVTGVRGWTDPQVVLTGSIITKDDGGDDVVTAMIYLGDLVPTDPAGIYKLEPQLYQGETTGSTFYGPDTPKFNPDIGPGTIRAVGTCTFEKGQARNHGMTYQGSPDGDGGWALIDMPDKVAGGEVWNTIPHSTMGTLIVGNYDLKGQPESGNAFMRSFSGPEDWQRIELEGLQFVTFYGIWQNGRGSSSYTICGGAKEGAGINQGLLVDYDSSTGKFTNQRLYRNPDNAVVITHFEGITLGDDGAYYLAALSDEAALLASVRRTSEGFGDAIWSLPYNWSGASETTGNTVYQNVLMGVFTTTGSPVQSYAYTPGLAQGLQGHAQKARMVSPA